MRLPIVMLVVLALSIAPASAAPSSARSLGVSLGGGAGGLASDDLDRELDSLVRAGARWVRLDANWAVVADGGPGRLDWTSVDRVVEAARSRRLGVLLMIAYTPEWARPPGTDDRHGPADPRAYARFAEEVARRYAPRGVHHYEIWNEPNIVGFWKPRPNIVDYADLLKASARAIRRSDPRATIVSGGTSPAESDGRDVAPSAWVRDLYAAGARTSFDAVGHHPYSWPALPGESRPWSAWYAMHGAHEGIRATMVARGDARKRIWATEFGAPTGGPRGSAVTEARQATIAARGIRLWRRYEWAGPLMWYSGRDLGRDRSTRENFFGLLRHDFRRKPAWYAYRSAGRRRAGR